MRLGKDNSGRFEDAMYRRFKQLSGRTDQELLIHFKGYVGAMALANTVREMMDEELSKSTIIRIETDFDSVGYSGRIIIDNVIDKIRVKAIIKLLDGEVWCTSLEIDKHYNTVGETEHAVIRQYGTNKKTRTDVAKSILRHFAKNSKLRKTSPDICKYWRQRLHESLIPILSLYKQLHTELTKRRKKRLSKEEE